MKNNYHLPKKVGILYSDVKRKYFPTKMQYITERGAYSDAKIISGYLKKMGIQTALYPGNSNLPLTLKKNKPDLVINLVDSFKGNEFLASAVLGVLEMLEIPYTGAGLLGQSLNYNKFLIKKIFVQNGIPVPNYQLFDRANEPISSSLRFPLITKLNEIHGSVEITDDSVVESESDLRRRLKYLINTYQQSVLVEEYVVGVEVTAVVLEGFKKKVYLGEVVINDNSVGKYKFKKFEYEWLEKYEGAVRYQKYQDKVLCEYAKKAFQILDMSDYGRFDVRIDPSGRYFFLDANTNPQLGPHNHDSPVGMVLHLYGVPFSETLRRILLNTMKQWSGRQY